jgi:hypothetical protein
VAYGATTKEVADQLGMSSSAVKKGREGIFEKLGANDRAEAVARHLRRMPRRRPLDEGAHVRFCQQHECCYEVARREVSEPTAGTWHFRWAPATRTWHLQNSILKVSIERPVSESVAPSAALLGAILGKRLSHIADGVEKLGFPPPGCKRRARGDGTVIRFPPRA